MKILYVFAVALLAFNSVMAGDIYYPKGSISDFEQKWYGAHLSAMKEPLLILRENGGDDFALRILYLPTFDRPISLRFEKVAGVVGRRAVMLSGKGGYDPGVIKNESQGILTKSEFDALVADIRSSGFWDLSPKNDIDGCDGVQLVIEVIQDGKHVVFVRWTPEHNASSRGLVNLIALYKRLFQESGLLKTK